jgi:ABC-type branched-subunit amino acid transport system ATPase component
VSDLSAPVLAVQDLHREFGGVHAVNGASFTVPPGRITGLIGPNGAGKTTALNIIAGALKPSAGTVSYQGKDITGLPSYKVARRGIIRTFQLSSEFAALTVLENLLVAAPAQRGEALWQRRSASGTGGRRSGQWWSAPGSCWPASTCPPRKMSTPGTSAAARNACWS